MAELSCSVNPVGIRMDDCAFSVARPKGKLSGHLSERATRVSRAFSVFHARLLLQTVMSCLVVGRALVWLCGVSSIARTRSLSVVSASCIFRNTPKIVSIALRLIPRILQVTCFCGGPAMGRTAHEKCISAQDVSDELRRTQFYVVHVGQMPEGSASNVGRRRLKTKESSCTAARSVCLNWMSMISTL